MSDRIFLYIDLLDEVFVELLEPINHCDCMFLQGQVQVYLK